MVEDCREEDIKLKEEEWEKEKDSPNDIDIIDVVDTVWNLYLDFNEIIHWSHCLILLFDLVRCEQVQIQAVDAGYADDFNEWLYYCSQRLDIDFLVCICSGVLL